MAEKAKQQQPRFAFSFPVTFVLFAIAYIYFSTVFVFIDRWLGLFSSPGIANAAVFTVIAVMSLFSYRAAISTDPGRVPATYTPDIEDNTTPLHEIKRKFTDENGQREYIWQTSWAVSTRFVGGIIMTHGDDAGLMLPPKIAPIQAI